MAQGVGGSRRGALGRVVAVVAVLVSGTGVSSVLLSSEPARADRPSAVTAAGSAAAALSDVPAASDAPASSGAAAGPGVGTAPGVPAAGVVAIGAPKAAAAKDLRWVGTWSTPVTRPVAGQALAGFRDATIRQRVHVSLGGSPVRVRLTNVYGTRPLRVGAVTVALARGRDGTAQPGTLSPVRFGRSAITTVAAGTELASDPVALVVPPDSDLLITLHVLGRTGPATYHPAARATGWTASGDHTADPDTGAFAGRTTSWWFLDGVDVQSTAAGAVAFVGDSITDGTGSTPGLNRRWTDFVADRVLSRPAAQRFGVLNAGIAGNRVLLDGGAPGQGDRVPLRLDRDALGQTGVRTVVLFEGVNDIQQAPVQQDPARIIAGLEQVAAQAHAAGLRVVGATIAPFEGWSQWTPQRDAVREQVNAWIRTTRAYDHVLDFDVVLRDPDRPQRLQPGFDSGDHLHPGDAAYAAMAASVDLDALLP
ncbi:SGNH/GDSL hydrolase family protein [Phycicoccus sp. SLBN-51]|uniref:SGNH/GDSL hydrolase family protein n=1 Tax=Phycicoccus sp. SLBN-51 TaxID=2768447 RepID=UPI00116F6BFD|nr:SGNH/GDSL hydrolase family protein [Phycicoccus sp. SLBN-51]TQJ49813.1 lysophospholipase L1-like esterase [Phycicoccus sp. SLBN-51]